ncbi:MAG TPA: CHAD domain-containing protein [Verrucomicrobiae bacterium]|nr:CHAD domain-containing protein [Verrucomicrobiae bacterium]
MAVSIPLGVLVSNKHIGLETWMTRVLELCPKVEDSWDADAVHDLRVALRRCRTMADALSEVNPSPGWRKLKKASRNLFHQLGVLRDTQVEREWAKKLAPAVDAARKTLLAHLTRREKQERKIARQALEQFDRKEWKKWLRKLPEKERFFPLESVVYQRLALAQLNSAVGLFQAAQKGRSRVAWHRLRIGLKRFRYTVENFLPQRSEVWIEDLKRLQDLLGEVHDLDVLRAEILRLRPGLDSEEKKAWLGRIEGERESRLREVRSRISDEGSLWLTWRAGFGWNHALHSVPPAGTLTPILRVGAASSA